MLSSESPYNVGLKISPLPFGHCGTSENRANLDESATLRGLRGRNSQTKIKIPVDRQLPVL